MGVLLLREICELTGVTRRAVQGYEKEGLVRPSSKNKQGYLLYDQEAVVRIKEIKLFQERGFSLKEIKSFETLSREDYKFKLTQKASELEELQSHLEIVALQIQTIISTL